MAEARRVGLSRPAASVPRNHPPALRRSSGTSFTGSSKSLGIHQGLIYVIRGEKPHEPGESPEIMIYVGETNNISSRWEDHINGTCPVTKIYKPKRYIEITIRLDAYTERNVTLQYMREYGIDNVRGGPWTKLVMDFDTRKTIRQMICSEHGTCYRCNATDHYADTCTVATRTDHCRELIKTAGVTNISKLFEDAGAYQQVKRDLAQMQFGGVNMQMHATTLAIVEASRKRVLPEATETAPNSQE